MLSSRVINQALFELAQITQTSIYLTDPSGNPQTGFSPLPDRLSEKIRIFASSDESVPLFKETDLALARFIRNSRTVYILAVTGKSADSVARIALSELSALLSASEERMDKNHFIQRVLMDNVLLTELHEAAKKLKIHEAVPRAVCLLEASGAEDADAALTALQTMFVTAGSRQFICRTDMLQIAVVSELPAGSDCSREIRRIADMLGDMLDTQAMISVRIACGSPADSLTGLSQSYKEARMTMDVGKIFFPDQKIISYENLGIGRLIYQLPPSLCEVFLKETFDHNVFKELDKESMTTILRFFDNNLNISETARGLYLHRNTLVYRLEKLEKTTGMDLRKFDEAMTFKIAMMVNDYLTYTKENQKK
ncbi:MAG: helix-turn-helix domain-containing protein [Eubacterium sp.]|nr:helix-turn-helix domain-containing protein [Eubacterium sp.]